MPVDKVNGFPGDGIREVFFLQYRLTSSKDWVVGIIVGLVALVGGVDHLAKSSNSLSPAGEYFPP